MPTPASASVLLLDTYALRSDGYTGRWIVNIPPFTPPGDGQVNEFDFAVAIPGGSDLLGFYIGNDDTGDPGRFAGGVILDSAALPRWITYCGVTRIAAGSWDVTNAATWDGTWTNFDLGYAITIDPDSAADWNADWSAPSPVEMLDADDSTFETSLGDWVPFATTGTMTLTRVTAPTHAGTGAMEIHLDPTFFGTDTVSGTVALTVDDIPTPSLVTVSLWAKTEPGIYGHAGSSAESSVSGLPLFGVFASNTPVDETEWVQLEAIFLLPGPEPLTITFGFILRDATGFAVPATGYLSDASVSWVPLAPPSGLGAMPVGDYVQLTWDPAPMQYVAPNHIDSPESVKPQVRIEVERDSGAGYEIIHAFIGNEAGADYPHAWFDAGNYNGVTWVPLPPGTYDYRVRKLGAYNDWETIGDPTAYTNVATATVLGAIAAGWGVGQIRMGAN